MARKLEVEIIGDASSLEQAFGKSSKAASGWQKGLKTASIGAAAALGGIAVAAKLGFDELADGQKVAAQTAAVLKSTGGAANISAKHVDTYATSLSQISGIDDEVIASGENLLLTFTGIRNEVGKGNDIFDQATLAATNLSVALGQDMKSSAIQVGKALNDPIKGITALRRVGVSFTASQIEQVKSMVASGKTMDAQKLILAELNKEFGGSAKAAGDTLPGQLNKLKNSFEELAGQLVTALLPALEAGIGILSSFAGFMSKHATATKIAIAAVVGLSVAVLAINAGLKVYRAYVVATAAVTKVWAAAQRLLNVAMLTNPFVLIAAAVIALGIAFVIAYKKSETFREIVQAVFGAVKVAIGAVVDFVTETLLPAFSRAFEGISKVVMVAWDAIRPIFEGIEQVIQGLVDFVVGIFTGDWSRAWDGVKQIVTGAFDAIKAYILLVPGLLLKALFAVGKAIIQGIQDGITAAWPGVRNWFTSLPGKIVALLASAGEWLFEKGKATIMGLLRGYVNAWVNIATWYLSLYGKVLGFFANAASWLFEKGVAVIGGLLRGLVNKWVDIATWYASLPGKVAGYFRGAATWLYNVGVDIIQGLWDGLKSKWDDVTGWLGGLGPQFPKIKGPPAEDRKLLHPTGLLIMQGLEEGLVTGWQRVETQLGAMTSKLRQSGILAAEAFHGGLEASTSVLSEARDWFGGAQESDSAPVVDSMAAVGTSVTEATATLTTFQDVITALPPIAGEAFTSLTTLIQKALAKLPVVLEPARLALDAIADAIERIGYEAYVTRSALQDTVNEIEALTARINNATNTGGGGTPRQHGGPVRAGSPYIVGEAGPELFIPRNSGKIIPNGSAAMAGGGMVNLNFYGPTVGTSREFEDTVRRAIYNVSRRNPGSGL